MVKDTRVVVGSFNTEDQAETILRDLKTGGYKKEDITLYANEETMNRLRKSPDIDVKTSEVSETTNEANQQTEENNDSFWDQVKDMFTTESNDETYLTDQTGPREDSILTPYQDDIKDGNIVIVVNNYQGELDASVQGGAVVHETGETNVAQTSVRESRDADDLTNDEKLRLKEERLEVDKEEVQTGEVNVRKETKHDTETVDVPVEREEVVIERKPVVGEDTKTTDKEIDEDSESYTIPVKEEKVNVDKEPVVKEEVEIKKKREQDVETVSEDVKREEVDVERRGRTGNNGTKKDTKR